MERFPEFKLLIIEAPSPKKCVRSLNSQKGIKKGRLRIRVPNDSNTAEGDYLCPECGNQGQISQEWKRPFNVKCGKCGFLMRMAKLKDEIKREKKKKKA